MQINLRPRKLKLWTIIIAISGMVGSLIAGLSTIKTMFNWVVPEGVWLNYNFISLVLYLLLLSTILVLYHLWAEDFIKLEDAERQKENYFHQLTVSEQSRLMDYLTGLPNGEQFAIEIDSYYKSHPRAKQVQVAQIDIRNFKKINSDIGHYKADIIFRRLAQHIHKSMRRNENMYRAPEDEPPPGSNTYRRYNGGDELLLIIEGNQAEALGFINRLHRVFRDLSPLTREWVGELVPLAFICALVPLEHGDKSADVLARLGQCYSVAAESKNPFSICWFDRLAESRTSHGNKKDLEYYRQIRENFDVIDLDADTSKAANA